MTNGFSVPEIEQAALSAMMQWPECMNEGVELLKPGNFSTPANRILFDELLGQWSEGRKCDLIVFTNRLREKRLLEQIGGEWYVTTTYASTCHSAEAFPYYVEILVEQSSKRELVSTCTEVSKSNLDGEENAVGDTIARLSEIETTKKRPKTFGDAADEKWERMQSGLPDADMIPTGLVEIDEKSPLRLGDMPLIGGEKKSGKSILALTIATNVAQQGVSVLYFSLEDRVPKVMDRLFAGISRIPMGAHHVGKMNADQKAKAAPAYEKLQSLNFVIRDDVQELNAIMAVARRHVAQHRVTLIVIDYAQLVRVKADSRREEVEKVSRDLRLLAMELSCPLILLCQLNKDGDTRESMALSMDATAMWKVEVEEAADKTQERFIRVPWQRNGESGLSFPVVFLGSIARFENPAPQSAFKKVGEIMQS